MASVRMTNDLRRAIITNAINAFDVADPTPKPSRRMQELSVSVIRDSEYYRDMSEIMNKSKEFATKFDLGKYDNDGDWRYIQNGGGALGFKPAIAARTLRATCINLYIQGKESANGWGTACIGIELDTPTDLLNANMYYGKSEITFFDSLLDKTKDDVREFMTAIEKFETDKKERKERYQNYTHKIKLLLEQCTTLKQLLEAWPAAESFVPRDKLQQLNVKVTRAQRAAAVKQEVEFDDSEFNKVVLTAKLIGS
jgi:hypothetical protein